MKLRDVGWNLLGLTLPLAVALVCIPILLRTLGNERFGLLALAWGLTAVAGLFDLGIGRAATQRVAYHLGRGEGRSASLVGEVAVRLTICVGLLGAMAFALFVAAGGSDLVRVAQTPRVEVTWAASILAAAIPFQALIATYRGVAEAHQRFRAISLIRIGLGVSNFAAPVVVSQLTHDVGWLVGSLLLSRLVALLAYRRAAAQRDGPVMDGSVASRAELRSELLRAGGWVTVSSIVSPILVHADRFVIGASISASAVAAYTVPFDLVLQLLVFASAVSTVALPSLAFASAVDRQAARKTFLRWFGFVTILMGALAGISSMLLPLFLPWWTADRLPLESVWVGQILCIGLWINALGVMLATYLHSAGRFRVTAWLHLAQLPPFIALLMVMVSHFGVLGAAISWVVRVAVDTVMMAIVVLAERGSARLPASGTRVEYHAARPETTRKAVTAIEAP